MAERTDDGRKYMPKLKCPYGNHRFADVPNVLCEMTVSSSVSRKHPTRITYWSVRTVMERLLSASRLYTQDQTSLQDS